MPERQGQSESVENFLKAVYTLQQQNDRVSTNALAKALSITAPSVTDMAKRLVDEGLVEHKKYYGVRLTEAGENVALTMIRRHRLIELYLVKELGYKLYEVHDEAEALEHAVSDHFVEAIDRKLGKPEFDPHGDPIPSAEGVIARRELQPLVELPLNTPASVSRFISENNDMLQYTLAQGFKLSCLVEVLAKDPFEGPLTVQVAGEERVIGYNVASSILVEVVS